MQQNFRDEPGALPLLTKEGIRYDLSKVSERNPPSEKHIHPKICSDLKIQKSTYENWESRELWQAHIGNQHLQDYMAATEGAVEEFTLNEMTHIP